MRRVELGELNEILREALRVARTEPRKALDLLEAGLQKARKGDDRRGACSLARNAGILCTELGDLLGACKYYEEALNNDAEDAYLHFASGDILVKLGRRGEARLAFTRSLELAKEQADGDMVMMASEARARLGETSLPQVKGVKGMVSKLKVPDPSKDGRGPDPGKKFLTTLFRVFR